MKGKAKIWCLVIASLIVFLTISPAVAKDKDLLVYTVDQSPAGTTFAEWDLTLPGCQQYGKITEVQDADFEDVDLEAGDICGPKGAEKDLLAIRLPNGLWIYNWANNGWIRLNPSPPMRVTVGNLGQDEKLEIICTYKTGVYFIFWNGSRYLWRQITSYVPRGDIAAGDINRDGLDEVVVGFYSGTWYWNPANGRWTKITSYRASNLAAGDMNGDGRAEIVGAFKTGIWSWDGGIWRRLTGAGYATDGDITIGDFDGNGRDDLASCWPPGGTVWVLWDNGMWERIRGCSEDIRAGKITKGKIR